MWSNIFIALMITFMSSPKTDTQMDVAHYYIKINGKHTDNDRYKVEFGLISSDEKQNLKLHKTSITELDNISDILKDKLSVYEDLDLNIYIHGMWANNSLIWKKTAKTLVGDLKKDNHEKQVILSIIWDTGVVYENSVAIALNKGRYLSDFFYDLIKTQSQKAEINIVAHSMGNRLFQGLVENRIPAPKELISTYFAIGADLENNIFEKKMPLEKLPTLVKKTVVYIHNNDRTLKISAMLNKNDRLGIVGLKDSLLQSDKYKVIDVSLVTDNEGLGGSFSNHRYYYTSPLVRQDINAEINNTPSENRVLISERNRYMISPPTD